MPIIDFQSLIEYSRDIFIASSASPADAQYVAQCLVHANLAGHDAEGVIRIGQYIDAIKKGDLVPQNQPITVKSDSSLILVDGQRGFGQLAARYAVEEGIKYLNGHTMGVIGARNLHHPGRLRDFTCLAAKHNVVCLGLYNGGTPEVAPFGGRERISGANSIALGIPMIDGDCLDVNLTSSAATESDIRIAQNRKTALPDDLIMDTNGHGSTNPDAFYAGGSILPVGGRQGSALSMLIELLAGIFTGAKCSVFGGHGYGNGILFFFIKPNSFVSYEQLIEDAMRLRQTVEQSKPVGGDSVLFPGEQEKLLIHKNRNHGVDLDGRTWEMILEIGNAFSVAPPRFH